LEEERKGLESARMGLVNEGMNLKKLVEHVKGEIAKSGGVVTSGVVGALNGPGIMGTTGQGQVVMEVQGESGGMEGPIGEGGNVLSLT